MKKTPSQRTGRHGQIQTLTKQQLNLLTPADLKRLAAFAERRMDWLPRARMSAQDVVQKALHSIIRGTKKGAEGRRPPLEKLRTKEAFLHYVRSAINSVVEAMKRKRELLFDHETIDRDQDTEHEPRVILGPGCPSYFGDLVRRNEIANLAQNAELRPCWVDRFLFHPCLVAGPKRQPNTFVSKPGGWLWKTKLGSSGE